jgi:hypothetical protein
VPEETHHDGESPDYNAPERAWVYDLLELGLLLSAGRASAAGPDEGF